MSADLTRFLTVLLWAGVAWAFLAVVALIARAHHARTLDYLTWGECPRCGKDDCWCDRDGDGWRDLMDAARDEERHFAAWEQEVGR